MAAKITWSAEEVEAAVDAYVALFEQLAEGGSGVKQPVFEELSRRYGRSVAAYNYRFRNISYVLRKMNLPTLPGSSFADHVGPTAEATIRQVIEEKGYFRNEQPTADPVQLERHTRALRRRGTLQPPAGNRQPRRTTTTIESFVRDPFVKAYVLQLADGHCERCGQPAPFLQEDGTPFLEVHHVKWLAQRGSDTVENAVALCPNCHRQFHYGVEKQRLVAELLARVPRLQPE